jgi:hypothetical protein
MNIGSGLGLFLVVVLVVFVGVQLVKSAQGGPPAWKGASAKLPCLADSYCPMGQKCIEGSCSENFTGSVIPAMPQQDMSSCTAKECQGINTVCTRKEAPCPEGTFCQDNGCTSIMPPSEGEAYNQIGMLLN